MLRQVLMGTAAGAAGTVALNMATYLDMALRGRPASEVPAKAAEKIAASVGVPLAPGGAPADAQQRQQQEQQAESRKEGLGALMGYAAGLGVGTVYGLVRPSLGELPLPVSAAALGLAAMAAGDVPLVSLRVTDPRTWGLSGWLADILPHIAYGLVAAMAYEAFTAGALGRRSSRGPAWAVAAARHSSRRVR